MRYSIFRVVSDELQVQKKSKERDCLQQCLKCTVCTWRFRLGFYSLYYYLQGRELGIFVALLSIFIPLVLYGFSGSSQSLPSQVTNPRCACAVKVTVVGLSVCVCLIPALQATRWPMSIANGFRTTWPWQYRGNIPETTAFERYAVKTSWPRSNPSICVIALRSAPTVCTLACSSAFAFQKVNIWVDKHSVFGPLSFNIFSWMHVYSPRSERFRL